MWLYIGLGLVAVWFIFFRKKSVVDIVQDMDSKEFLWKITKASEKLMSKDPKLATMQFPFASRNWSAVLECKDGNVVLSLKNEIQFLPELEAAFFLGVGINQFKGQALFYWYETKLLACYAERTQKSSWTGPSKSYLLKNQDVMLPDDVLTLFIRISTYPSPFCIMAKNRQGYSTHYNEGAEEDNSNKGEWYDRVCLDCKVLKNLSKNFKDLYLEDKDPDIRISVRNGNLRAHRLILKARSPVLAAMFLQGVSEIQEYDWDPKVFETFLLFLYSGTVESLNNDNVIPVYDIAVMYEVPDLMEVCAKYMVSKLTVNSVCTVISVALKYKDYKLLVLATDFFLENAEKIFPTAEWQTFLTENPTKANELVIKSYSYKRS